METPLLATKLFVPTPRAGLAARPRLMERLKSALDNPFTLVSAPAGFGKTTVLTQWIASNKPPVPVAWLQLDEGDNDPVRFWDYFIAALKTLKPESGNDAAAALHSPQGYSIETVLTSLLNDIVAMHRDLILVMDDYHVIKTDTIHDALSYFLDHCPPAMHLVVGTRVDPKLPLARFLGRGAMIEIGADDLRFTSAEADDFFRLQGVELGSEDLIALNARTEGWAVGLRMAALAIHGNKDIGQFLTSFTGSQRYVTDYLVEEVLKRQPPEVHDFLLASSVLERMTAPLCDSLTGRNDGREMLAGLEQANLFLVPLDGNRRWYRYHHLFAELLRHQLEIISGEAKVRQLHQQASQWYEEHNFIDDAVHHSLTARDWERAMRLTGTIAEDRFKRGEIVTLFDWLRVVPESSLSTNLYLYRQYARTLIETGHLDAAELALSSLQRTAQGDANLEGEVAALQADAAQKKGNLPRAIEMGERALSLLSPDNLVYRCWASYRLGFNQHYLGFLDAAWGHLTDAFEIARQTGDRYSAAWAANFMAAVMHQRGDLKRALDVAGRGLEIAGQTPAAAGPNCRLAIIPYELNDLKTAADNARLAVEWNRLTGDSATVVGYIYLALALLASGDATGAAEAMKNCDRAVGESKIAPLFHARHIAGRVIFALRVNDLETASQWGRRLSDYPDCFPFEFAHVPARLLIAQGRKAEAVEQLGLLYEKAMKVGAHGLAIGTRVCQSLAAGNAEEALTFLSDALVKAEPEGYVRTFVDEGKLLKPLLRKAVARGIMPEYTNRLLSIIDLEEGRRKAGNDRTKPGPQASSPLHERELEIVRLLASGLSNQQIADRLFLTLGTVKVHVHNIMGKLSARNRTEAVARARKVGLLLYLICVAGSFAASLASPVADMFC